MKRSAHEMTMEQAFARPASPHYRREIEQRREGDVEQDEIEAARAWLGHVEAGRIGPSCIANSQ